MSLPGKVSAGAPNLANQFFAEAIGARRPVVRDTAPAPVVDAVGRRSRLQVDSDGAGCRHASNVGSPHEVGREKGNDVAAVLTVVPGLDTTLVLRSALVRGNGYAVATALGIGTGALIWGAAAAVGAAALLAASEVAYRVVTLGGAVYLVYLGVMLIVKSFRTHGLEVEGPAGEAISKWRGFLTGVWTNLLNPKIGAFYLATIPQFVPAGVSPLGMGLLLAGVHDLLAVRVVLVDPVEGF